jgi:dihydrolipoamide dehydrogenase
MTAPASTASANVDVVIIGGGPGGYATALRAVAHGLRVTIVEAGAVGGTCLHRGCVPSKALLHVAQLADRAAEAVALGLASPGPGLDVDAAGRLRDRVVGRLHDGLAALLQMRGVEIVDGWGELVAPDVVSVATAGGSSSIGARHVVIATGSAVVELPGVPFDHEVVLNSDDALELRRVPRSGVVIGGGAVGVEIASLWRSLGSEVVLIEAAPHVLPLEDSDSSRALERAFRGRGIALRTGTSVVSAVHTDNGARVELTDGTTVDADQIVVAVGRRPATQAVGLQRLDLVDERGFVKVDALGRTAIDNVWAVGDVVPTLSLAHAAFGEGFVVADAIAGLEPTPVDHHQVPRVTYCTPEVASVGLTESEARAVYGDDVTTSVLPFAGNARALIEDATGQVKLVVGPDGTLLGTHIVGPAATELIGEATVATTWGALVDELAAVSHAHPTLTEVVGEAALAAAGLAFHSHR